MRDEKKEKVLNCALAPCPKQKGYVITAILYESGEINYYCPAVEVGECEYPCYLSKKYTSR
jgi:hypothetical protein